MLVRGAAGCLFPPCNVPLQAGCLSRVPGVAQAVATGWDGREVQTSVCFLRGGGGGIASLCLCFLSNSVLVEAEDFSARS